MKFEVRKSVFLDAIQTAASAVPSRSTLQILNNFLLRLEGSWLEISATDMDMGIRVRVEVNGQENGAVVVNAKKLLDLIKVLPDDNINIMVEDYLLQIAWSEQGKATIAGFDASDFPQFPEISEGLSFNLSSVELAFLTEKTSFAVSTDSTRLILNGIYMEYKDGQLIFVATDGHRMGKAHIEQENLPIEQGVIIPNKAISQILRAKSGDAPIEISFDDSHVLFSGEDIQVVSKLIEGDYPKYESVIPSSFEKEVQANRMELIQVLRHASAVANQRTRQVRLSFEENSLEVSASDPTSGGECRESFAVNYQGESPFTIGFNGMYLQQILEMCSTEEIRIKMNSVVGAVIIEPIGEGLDFFFLLMPLRLVEDA
ncbi:MAG: DNA polymerase III subunit beta [Fibrobacter sp.]|nr:DNA polymerase III subunit beta [Fibrobacter sp.]